MHRSDILRNDPEENGTIMELISAVVCRKACLLRTLYNMTYTV